MAATGIDFDWLADLQKSQCFTTCEVSNPAKSSDFGADGFTASLTDWHELLQLTAPDDTCGIVFVRGQFPNNPAAILARAQRRDDVGGKGTFGTRLQPAELDTDLELGERLAQGWINFRWPFTQYEVRQKGDPEAIGTYEEISYVRAGTVFQIIRIKWGHGSSLSDFDPRDPREKRTMKFKSGGLIRFGCPCSKSGQPEIDTFQLTSVAHGTRLRCTSEKYQKLLEMQLFVNGAQQRISDPLRGVDRDDILGIEVDMSSTQQIEITESESVFIVSTYALRDVDNQENTVSRLDFSDLDDHLGISSSSVHMTDRLWTALCSSNYEASEAAECCVVGRCIEQILCVSAVPLQSPASPISPYEDPVGEISPSNEEPRNESISLGRDEFTETALVCNIMTPQYVDVQCTFFQIRALVKSYNFISTRHFEPDLLERFVSLERIRKVYLTNLRRFIRSTLIWLINTDLKPGRLLLALKSDAPIEMIWAAAKLRKCDRNRVLLSRTIDQTYNQACYAMLSIWYVMKNCPVVITDSFKARILQPQLKKAFEQVQKRSSRDKEPTPKNDVLQWLHLSCLFLMCNESLESKESGQAIDGFAASGLDRQEVLRTQQKFEKYVSRLKTIQIESYSMLHEELERVLLLAEELGLDAIQTSFTSSLASSRAVHTRRRLLARKRTMIFKPGPKAWKGFRPTSNGPWELFCTNHQSFLRVADDSDVRNARDRLFEFLTADYSVMTSWDRADSNMVGTWWNFEPASVICATLLDLKVEGKLRSAMSITAAEGRDISQSLGNLTSPIGSGTGQSTPSEEVPRDESLRDIGAILLEIKKSQEESNRNLLRQLQVHDEIGASLTAKVFDWMAYKPGPIFHPDWWVQSLHDTPDVYEVKQTKDVPLRKDIKRYLRSRQNLDLINFPEYTLDNIDKKIPAEDLQFLSIFDLQLTSLFTFDLETTSIKPPASTTHLSATKSGSRHGQKDRGRSRSAKAKQVTNIFSVSELDTHRQNLFEKLNDSLVDLGVKHRILFAEKCTPSLVGSFIYIWHPDALDTIDSYFGATSRFAENREAMMWTTTITLSHWSIRPTSNSREHLERFRENRSNGEFPPQSISNLGLPKKQRRTPEPLPDPDIVEERSSSLVITGDPQGHLWICSMWSSLTDFNSLSSPVGFIPKVMQRFIHQQSCARCLVFLVLLGHLCESLAGEYEEILDSLDIIVGLGDKVLLEGLEWGTSEAVDKLKKLLWGLEALRVFDDRLSASLAQIGKAQEAMERTIKQEAGQQHVDLLQEYNNVVEEFEKRFGMLSDVHITTQLKISQITGLRDGISTVTNVEDSQTALRDSKTTIRQGNNIRILTYITIAYLPLGFVTGLFSIAHASFMDSAGNGGFAILVVIFILGTFALALSLETIIDQWQRLRKEEWRASNMTKNPPPRHDDDSKLSFNNLGSCWGLRRRKGSGSGSTGGEEKILRAVEGGVGIV